MTRPRGPNAKSTQRIREMIKTEELVNLLQDNILSPRRKPINQTKMTGIKILLSKTLPDLKALEQTIETSGTIDLNIQVEFIDKD